jgi:hypothetical protein
LHCLCVFGDDDFVKMTSQQAPSVRQDNSSSRETLQHDISSTMRTHSSPSSPTVADERTQRNDSRNSNNYGERDSMLNNRSVLNGTQQQGASGMSTTTSNDGVVRSSTTNMQQHSSYRSSSPLTNYSSPSLPQSNQSKGSTSSSHRETPSPTHPLTPPPASPLNPFGQALSSVLADPKVR